MAKYCPQKNGPALYTECLECEEKDRCHRGELQKQNRVQERKEEPRKNIIGLHK